MYLALIEVGSIGCLLIFCIRRVVWCGRCVFQLCCWWKSIHFWRSDSMSFLHFNNKCCVVFKCKSILVYAKKEKADTRNVWFVNISFCFLNRIQFKDLIFVFDFLKQKPRVFFKCWRLCYIRFIEVFGKNGFFLHELPFLASKCYGFEKKTIWQYIEFNSPELCMNTCWT